jgi:ubiquinone/menaquinone biosynthesis C-methylase UbiE
MDIKNLLSEKNIREYYKTHRNFIAPYKLDQFFDYKKFDNQYVDVKSNKQIKTIIKHSKDKNSYIYLKLITLFGRHIHINDATSLVANLLALPLKDITILRFLKKIKNEDTKHDGGPTMPNYAPDGVITGGRQKKVHQMKFVLEREFKKSNYKPEFYLDFGCGDCKLVKLFGESINIKSENMYGADIESWGEYDTKKRKDLGIKFVELKPNKKYDFKDDMFSVITCSMVLHHIDNLDFCLKELNRIMKIGGYLYITEHMIVNYLEKMLVDIEHSIYEIAYRDNSEYYTYYINNFYHLVEWDVILNHYGFEYVEHDYLYYNITDQDDSTKRAWLMYKKVKNIN